MLLRFDPLSLSQERIQGIFTEGAAYMEKPLDERFIYRGRAAIRDYWIRQARLPPNPPPQPVPPLVAPRIVAQGA